MGTYRFLSIFMYILFVKSPQNGKLPPFDRPKTGNMWFLIIEFMVRKCCYYCSSTTRVKRPRLSHGNLKISQYILMCVLVVVYLWMGFCTFIIAPQHSICDSKHFESMVLKRCCNCSSAHVKRPGLLNLRMLLKAQILWCFMLIFVIIGPRVPGGTLCARNHFWGIPKFIKRKEAITYVSFIARRFSRAHIWPPLHLSEILDPSLYRYCL